VDMYEASISKVLYYIIGRTQASELLIDKVERQFDISINRFDYTPTMYFETHSVRLVYEKREGCAA
jgi:hypothetical protein